MSRADRPNSKAARIRNGLSLLELLVVLTILIALGGIVVSTLPGMLRRTQVATAAANVPEIESTIRRMSVLQQGQIGDRFDSLVSGTDSLDGSIPTYVGGSEFFETTGLTADEIEALRLIGVTELIPANPVSENATYLSHDQPPVPIGTDTRVCMLSNESAPEILRSDWNLELSESDSGRYLVFGLGQQCTIVGAGTQAAFSEAPVHFSDERDQSPKDMYSRYLLLVELISRESGTVARYIGSGIPSRNGIRSVSRELEGYYTNPTN
ncbi:MAG: hypothetical protein AAF623_12110 [Planctomycetota bacterium]